MKNIRFLIDLVRVRLGGDLASPLAKMSNFLNDHVTNRLVSLAGLGGHCCRCFFFLDLVDFFRVFQWTLRIVELKNVLKLADFLLLIAPKISLYILVENRENPIFTCLLFVSSALRFKIWMLWRRAFYLTKKKKTFYLISIIHTN